MATPLKVVKYSVEQNREELIRLLVVANGPPTALSQSLQAAFVSGEMEPTDAIEFAKVCQEIIDSRTRWL